MANISNISMDPVNTFIPETTPLYFWILSATNGLITVVCNVLVICIVLKRRKLHRNHSNWLLLSLAASDLLVGIVMIPSLFICQFWLSCDWPLTKKLYDLVLHVTVVNLCVITIDRYVSVTCPLRYEVLVTRHCILWMIGASWCFPSITSLIPLVLELALPSLVMQEYSVMFKGFNTVVFELVPCVLLLIAYAHIFHICWKHSQNIKSVQRSMLRHRRHPSTGMRSRARSTVKVFCVVVPMFVICWSLAAYREICESMTSCPVPSAIVHISRLLLKGHSMVDPIVYAIQKRDIRKEITKALRVMRTYQSDYTTSNSDTHRTPLTQCRRIILGTPRGTPISIRKNK